MLSLLSDENFNGDILRGLYRRAPTLDAVRVQDVGLAEAPDLEVLSWAAAQGRVVVSHDRTTLPAFAYSRVQAGQPMLGVFIVSDSMGVGQAVDEILLAVMCLTQDECKDTVKYFPL